MKKYLFVLMTALFTSGYASAQSSKITAYTRMYLDKHKAELAQRAKGINKVASAVDDSLDTFLRLNEGESTAEIESNGVRVVNRFGQLFTVRMAYSDVEKVAALRSVKYINTGAPVHLCNDSARIATRVDMLQKAGNSLGQQYTGKGVIVGVVDTGIEYNHINFKDANGKSRVKMAYDAVADKTYMDPDQIAQLTTDFAGALHGTHTTGIAAGSYTKNGYQGMAPDADLVLCGQGKYLPPAQLTNSLYKIFGYADLVGEPAVVNLSLGSNSGPHDGTDDFVQTLNSMKSPGHILVYSAGNEAGSKLYLKHQSENEDDSLQFKTILKSSHDVIGTVDLWSKSSKHFSVRLGIVNTKTNELLSSIPMLPDSVLGSDYFIYDSIMVQNYPGFKYQIEGKLNKSNNRFNVNVIVIEKYGRGEYSDYNPVLMVYTKKGETIEGWINNADYVFDSYNLPGYIDGNDSCSITPEAYSNNVISVGAYVSKEKYYNPVDKKEHQFYDGFYGHTGDIATFSSYALNDDGTSYPTIVAPGATLISSVNSYNRSDFTAELCDSVIADDGKVYYWGAEAGTSMACPVVTGILATWLQYKPSLTVDEIKSIFAATVVDDYYVKKYNHVKSGMGKIDAYAGLQYMLTTNIGNPQCAQHQVLIYPSVESGRINVYAQGETGSLRVNVYSASGIQVYSDNVSTTDGSASIDLGNRFAKGVYIVKVEGSQAKGSNTLTVR